jgi:hypothetical protein
MRVGRATSHVLSGALAALLVGRVPGFAVAGQGNQSDSKSNDSSDGSKGSNDSSKSSGDSSKGSGDSSKRSNQNSEDSTRDSPKNSTKGTTDESSNSKGGAAISGGLLVLVVGATVIGVVLSSQATSRRQDQQNLRALVRFLQRNHALVTRDVMMSEGPMLTSWARAMGLSPVERQRLSQALEGSSEQTELLQALDGDIDEPRAQRFAAGFARAGRRAFGEDRLRAIALGAEG